MFDSIKHSFKQTAIYSLGNLSSKLIGLILLPLFTEYLTTGEYGILAILEATSQIIIGVLALNLPLAMLRWASAEKDEIQKKSIVFTTTISIITIIVIQLFTLLPLTNFFSNLLFDTDNYSNYFFYLFITTAFGIYNGIPLNLIRINEKPFLFIIVNSLKFLVILILNIILVAYYNMGVEGIVISQMIGEIILCVLTLPILFKNIIVKFNLPAFMEMLHYGLPLVLSTISTFIFAFGDRYILKYFLDESNVGIYAMGYKIASIINMLILQSFQLGFLPIAYKKLGEDDANNFFAKILTYYSLLLVGTALLISIYSKEILYLLAQSEEYWIAYSVVPLISLGFVIKGIQYTFALSFHYAKRTGYTAVIIMITALINFALNVILIQHMGYIGAAYAMVISILISAFISYYFGNKVYPIPYEIRKIIVVVFAGIFLYLATTTLDQFSLIITILIKAVLILLFPIILYLLKFFEKDELNRISLEITKIRKKVFK